MTQKQNEHRYYQLFGAMQSDVDAAIAVRGAKYHLHKINELYELPAFQKMWGERSDLDEDLKKKLQTNVNMFHWHIRAFFWELVAAFDTLMMWANRRYELGLEEWEVKWRNFKNCQAKKFPGEWKDKLALLRDAYNSDWFYEIRKYRNFSHRGFLFVRGLYNSHDDDTEPTLRMLCLLPVREGQPEVSELTEQIFTYLENIKDLYNRIIKN